MSRTETLIVDCGSRGRPSPAAARAWRVHQSVPSARSWPASPGSPSQRDHGRTFAGADQGRDVVAHARERIAAVFPSLILVVAGDEVGADVADGAGNFLTRLRLLAK